MNEPNMTRRQRIIEMLKDGPISFMSIANKLALPMKELKEDLEHVSKSVKLETIPAKCRKCEFIFTRDKRFKTPSKCPRCHGERIDSQKFSLQ